jgi:mycofactocin precursor
MGLTQPDRAKGPARPARPVSITIPLFEGRRSLEMRNAESHELTEKKGEVEAKEMVTDVVEEIEVEDLTVDGICGVY